MAKDGRKRLASCIRTGVVSGARSAAWLLAIMVPVSLGVTLLRWVGVLGWLALALGPAFALFGLPGEAALSFLTGAFTNIYTAIAVMGSIPLTDRQVTILAFMVLVAHNLPVEVPVQKKAGSSGVRMLALRLAAAVAGAAALNLVLPDATAPPVARGIEEISSAGLLPTLGAWAKGSACLVGKVVGLVVALMVLQRILEEFGVARVLARAIFPLLWLLGLPRRVVFLWIVANTLGLAYGAAVILDEAKSGRLRKEDAEILNRHVAICHSLLEDTLLFVVVGAWALWITLPRIALAAGAVWIYRAARRLSPAGPSSPPAGGR